MRLGNKALLLKIMLIAIVVVVLSIPILYAYFMYTPTVNVQCGICHTMRFYVGNISTPHAKYSCLVCHEIDLGSIANMMWKYIVEQPRPDAVFEKYYPHKDLLESCNKCHTEPEKLAIHKSHLSIVETTGTCSICHAIHIQDFLQQSCTKCHPYLDTVEKHMQMHGSTTALLAVENCAKCHSPQSPAYVPPANTCLQGAVEGKSCLACHTQLNPPDITGKQCTSCHYK
ncbi:hypothetical protein [Pyrobaculum arsenaticum]|uniref:NapC/NirT cytochrome c N-terminal domain-containing protein n=1 Tax=Pyrobaculum arsenaticum TaxID=121277 RepID=A0A7L4P628_9CREN|nr:hypothetical protein [Pyrobaculum arsenaticum]